MHLFDDRAHGHDRPLGSCPCAWIGSTEPSSIICSGASSILNTFPSYWNSFSISARNGSSGGAATSLNKRATEAEAKLKRLYEAIENGLINMADLSLKDRIAELTAIRDQAQADAERAQAAVERISSKVTAKSPKRFSEIARAELRSETGEYHRDHLCALAQRVEVVSKSEIRLMGNKSDLVRRLAAASSV
ncbi:hypothetical protein J2X65_003341 [Ancylobacter sp. 3268]|uniref:hypothetical protein n=1 Tax=Ancylobacter sp. 3268 TaxID=2817752 RepID=UPI0028629B25|nr:hypothetical protein [Ancylobacter sp. 3268]MDR6953974.1 hypothetical protein [Ancylobacter sp. 3268]